VTDSRFVVNAAAIVQKLLDRSFYLAHDLVEAALAEVGE